MRSKTASQYLDLRELGGAAGWIVIGGATLALLSWVAFRLQVNLATACLVYLTVVALFSMTGNVVPAIVLALAASACLNYFFTEPRFSLAISRPEDVLSIIAFVLLAVLIAVLVKRARLLGERATLRDQLQLIIDTIPAVVWSNLPDGSDEFLNQRFRDYSGLSGGDGRGPSWMRLLHPDDSAAVDWSAILAAGEPFEREARLRAADGAYRRFLLRFVPQRDRQGTIRKCYPTSTDIEDLKRTEEALRQREAYLRDAQAELAHVNRVTTAGQLAASIAHEVAQPVAASVTNANAALRWLGAQPPNLDETREALTRIVRDGRRASDVLGRIRALVRKAPPRRDEIDVNETIVEVLALTRAELRRNLISSRPRLADGLPRILGDRVQLQQVMLNLILNAIEAMSGRENETRELTIATALHDADEVRITVRDTGPGLPPESVSRLFDAFYTTKASGMGMGLSICRSIVEAHGGRLWASANEPRGAVFEFTVPCEAKAIA